MKVKILCSLLIASVLLVWLIIFYGAEEKRDEPEKAARLIVATKSQSADPGLPGSDKAQIVEKGASEEDRVGAMQAAFTDLVDLRKQLKSRANLLKSQIWGLKLPPADAKAVTDTMKRSYAYLKNPAMLGAYLELNDIRREIKSVKAMMDELEMAEKQIKAHKADTADQG